MSTLLELVNLARSEAGVATSDLATVQSGLSAESTRFVSWVKAEWRRLQAECGGQWKFLRGPQTFDTTANQGTYTAQQAKATSDGTTSGTPILSNYVLQTFRVSTAGSSYSDEQFLIYVPWEVFRDYYLYSGARNMRGKPTVFSVDPQNVINLGPVPDKAYTIGYEYRRTPQTLSADADTPLMPARFHDLIAYRALLAYAAFMSAPEVAARAQSVISSLYSELCNDQLEAMTGGPPLA